MKCNSFLLDVRAFLCEYSIRCRLTGDFLVVEDYFAVVIPVPINDCGILLDKELFPDYYGIDTIIIYEDLWRRKGDIIKNRLLAKFGKGSVVYARNCLVRRIDYKEAKGFLDANHILGYSRAKFKYGLYQDNKLVSVATFSSSRPMIRECGLVQSYEWVRCATLGSARVTGGMGKLLAHFVREENPGEVMSYADADWSEGNVYKNLGFTLAGRTSPVGFRVDLDTFERISEKKLLKDKKYRIQEFDWDNSVLLTNSGNFKFIRLFI